MEGFFIMSEVPLHHPLFSNPAAMHPYRVSCGCRGTSLIRNSAPLGPFSRTMPRAVTIVLGGGGAPHERVILLSGLQGHLGIQGYECNVVQ